MLGFGLKLARKAHISHACIGHAGIDHTGIGHTSIGHASIRHGGWVESRLVGRIGLRLLIGLRATWKACVVLGLGSRVRRVAMRRLRCLRLAGETCVFLGLRGLVRCIGLRRLHWLRHVRLRLRGLGPARPRGLQRCRRRSSARRPGGPGARTRGRG